MAEIVSLLLPQTGNASNSRRVAQKYSIIEAIREMKQDFPCKEISKSEVSSSPYESHEVEIGKTEIDKLKNQECLQDFIEEQVLDAYSITKASEFDLAMKNCRRVGAGEFGTVYKLCIADKCVAVKMLNEASVLQTDIRGVEQFDIWVENLCRIRHQNLVSVIGVCKVRGAIIYEFLPNGTLEERLKWPNQALTWGQRVNIALSICSALIFLHGRKPKPIFHGNLKSANILFDSKDTPKLCDVGLSCLCKLCNNICMTRHVRSGTTTGTSICTELEILRKSDILSLGIIFLQLVTGKTQNDIRFYVRGKYHSSELWKEKNQLRQKVSLRRPAVIDSRLDIHTKCAVDALEMLNLGLECSDVTKEVPSLADDVWPKIKLMSDRCLLA